MILKRILITLTAACLCFVSVFPASAEEDLHPDTPSSAEEASPVFSDTETHWAKEAIARWTELEIVRGDTSGNFRPDDPLTRAEMAVILQRVMRYQTSSDELFTDLREDWYKDSIQKLRAAGVMRGDENNRANPNSPITREEAVVLIARAFNMQPSLSTPPFPDTESVSSWALGYVASMADSGFVRGGDEGNFFPKKSMTRAEAVTILNNIVSVYIADSGSYNYTMPETPLAYMIIAADDVTVQNLKLRGNILFTEGVQPETVKLQMVYHSGRLYSYTADGFVRYLKAASSVVPIDPHIPTLRHDPSLFMKDDNGFITYNDPSVPVYFGVDVSVWQGNIDWKKLKEEGVYFAFIRAGYRGYEGGTLNKDANFENNIRGALDAGIKVGVYFFSQALNADEGQEEAKFLLELIKDYPVTFPVVFDWETVASEKARTNGLDTQSLCQAANAFCLAIEDAGYIPMIYSNQTLSLLNYDLNRIQAYDFWYAEYGNEQPTYYYDFDIWQYSSSGRLAGVPDAYVDLNISFVDYSKKQN